jgi:hypothetical protein
MIDSIFQGIVDSSNIRFVSGELDSAVSLRCEITQLPSNAVVCLSSFQSLFKRKNLNS